MYVNISSHTSFFSPSRVDPHHFVLQDITRHDLFRAAVKQHLTYAAWAADGQGVDRHFFGLKKMIQPGEPTPEVYTDPMFSKSNHWELSTSQLSSEYFDGWGYGEVVPDGYGLAVGFSLLPICSAYADTLCYSTLSEMTILGGLRHH